jgi:hypothetical protein
MRKNVMRVTDGKNAMNAANIPFPILPKYAIRDTTRPPSRKYRMNAFGSILIKGRETKNFFLLGKEK